MKRRKTTDWVKTYKSSEKGKMSFYNYYSNCLYDWNGLERQESTMTTEIYYESSTILRQGKLNGCLL